MRKSIYMWFELLIWRVLPPPNPRQRGKIGSQSQILPRWRGPGGGTTSSISHYSLSLSKIYFALAFIGFLSINPELIAQNDIDRSPNLSQLEASFLATPFSPQQFEAFSARGEQKFRDFLDYVSFLSSEEVEPLWKAHIGEQVKALFIEDSVSCLNEPTLSAFLKKAVPIASDESILEMELIQPFEKKDDHFVAVLETKISHKNGKEERILADLHLLKREKQFGEESISVWKVLLGSVKKK